MNSEQITAFLQAHWEWVTLIMGIVSVAGSILNWNLSLIHILSIVENPKPHGKSYNKWLGDQAKPSHRELLHVAIENALSQSPNDFEALLKLLQESGCEVSKQGKTYRLKLPG